MTILESCEGLSGVNDHSKWISLLILLMSQLGFTTANLAFAKSGYVTLLYYIQTMSSASSQILLDKRNATFNIIKIKGKVFSY